MEKLFLIKVNPLKEVVIIGLTGYSILMEEAA